MKRVVLHIGMHKTGSSSIQTALDGYRAADYEYAPLPPISAQFDDASNHSFPIRTGFVSDFGQLGNFLGASVDEAAFERMKTQCRQALADCLKHSKADNLIISAEEVTRFDLAEMQDLANFLRMHGHEVEVYAYVRGPVDYVSSATQEIVKSGHAGDNLHPLSYQDNFANAEAAFGRSHIHYRFYDRKQLIDGDSVADFCTWIGLKRRLGSSASVWRGLKKRLRGEAEVNVSLSTDAIRCIYALNRYGHIHFGNALLGASRLELQKELAKLLPGKFSLPSSMVQRELDAADVAWMASRVGQRWTPVSVKVVAESAMSLGDWLADGGPELLATLQNHLEKLGAEPSKEMGLVELVTQLYFECVRRVSGGEADYRTFSAERYLAKYDDVRQAGVNAFGHYLMYGQHEGRTCN